MIMRLQDAAIFLLQHLFYCILDVRTMLQETLHFFIAAFIFYFILDVRTPLAVFCACVCLCRL